MAAVLALFVITFAVVLGPAAADPDLLQDVCVADLTSGTPIILLLFFPFKVLSLFSHSVNREHSSTSSYKRKQHRPVSLYSRGSLPLPLLPTFSSSSSSIFVITFLQLQLI